MTQPNPLKTQISDPFPTQPNPTQPAGQPNPWTTLRRTTKFDVVTHMWRGLFRGQPRPLSQNDVAIADPNFAGSPLLMRTQLNMHYKQPNSA